ncbi:MAG: tetratricopeptide repeat protein [Candidatus Omnitrophica bacterium]|nr:tetratricopeptide repeat protein [Candidatus Omnitrophota bacterium]
MFTKEIIITLPFMILLYEFCFLRISSGLNWKRILPFFIISLIVPLVLFYTSSENSRKMIQLLKSAPDIPRWNYLLTQPRVMITYLRLLFIPLNQNLDYDYPVTHTFFEPPVLASFLFLLVILTAAIRIFHKHRLIAFAIFYFFLTLLPESSVVPLADVIFEHRLYLPMLGYSIFLVTIMYYLFKNKNLGVVILILIISGYAILTYSRNFAWQDDITLSKDLTLKSAKKPRTYVQLGNAYAKKKMYNQAIESLIKATELAPNYSEAYYNLGGVYYEKNDPDKAIFYLNQAIQLDPLDFQAYYFRGMSFGDKKEYAQAIADFNQALRLNPKYIESYRALAYTYQAIKNNDEAIIVYNKAIAINPGVAEVYIYAAEFCNGIGKYQMAMDLCKIALKINPNSHAVHFNLGYTYENMGNFDQAIKSFQKALTINPDSGSTYNLLSWAYYNIKNYNLAIQYYDKAIQLGYPANPNFLESLKNTNRKQTQNTQI